MRKKIICIASILLCFGFTMLLGQASPKVIVPFRILLSDCKTTNLIFPFSIKSVDRGSEYILAQKAGGVENVLQIKAGKADFRETNLTVITGDRHLYSFIVSYATNPGVLNFSFGPDSSKPIMMENEATSESDMEEIADRVKASPRSLHKRVRKEDIEVSLDNLFVKNNLIWLKITVNNNSAIPFTPAFARFSLTGTQELKRTAVQDKELTPFYKSTFEEVIAHGKKSLVFALPLFSIPQNKKLLIQLEEEDGGGLATLKFSHRLMHKIITL